MPIPDSVFLLVRAVMDRPDFAALEWRRDQRRWYVGLDNGRTHEDGSPKLTWYVADRLTPALEAARAVPLPGAVQAQLRVAGGGR